MESHIVPIFAFAAGVFTAALGLAIMSCATHHKPEPETDVKVLFRKLPLLPPESDEDTDDFQEYIAERLATSQAFRLKMVQGMARLHNHHSKVYAEVMRR